MGNNNLSKPQIPEVIDRFKAYYLDNPTWGSLHIVLDDYNLEDKWVDFCIEYAEKENDHEGLQLAVILRKMSKSQRARISFKVEEMCKDSSV